MNASLQDGERLDYITQDLSIIQRASVFAFSIDAVLLARFTYVPKTRGTIIDMCSGNGVIPLVLSTRSSVPITGVEIQPLLSDMAERSVAANQKQEQITMMEADVRTPELRTTVGEADLVTCNPPYFPTPQDTEKNTNPFFTNARHEENGTLDDIIRAASVVVKQKGKVSVVLRPERMAELFEIFRKYRLEPKRMKMIYPKHGKEANILLAEGMKDGKPGLTCLPPLTVYDEKDAYTEEFRRYYAGC
ncbi:tRNA1(Val) (adenine(37)-N6)-methyltransferase [Salibacterium halotolerans]|uniref:tRNA1(Val) A37 N6-methylase TrmN6 n=1 Tax=Salibacterium halotolerans TaxID=1884432 RepID=A0A1I5WN12_9BACI|nr:tRNA1(Val) (adenine(37)-N6)-methyltransferase [Salibacterium halotolerans]SFQ21193.1 tRNA1(Val) A37 N6-methylase TrmN6 [Salibacterium halotolerans]